MTKKQKEAFEKLLNEKGDLAVQMADDELAEELAKITKLTQSDIAKILPEKADKEKFAKLKAILDLETKENNKQAMFLNNIQELGGMVFKVLGAVI